MKFSLQFNDRTFMVSTRTEKNATSNYDTQLTVSENNSPVAGCVVKNSTPKKEIEAAAKKCIQIYLTTNYFIV